MIDKCTIIGCGTLGACLSIELAKTQKVSTLRLIDYDCVSGASYPFEEYEAYCPKVDVIKYICLLENPYMEIEAIQDKI